MAYGCEYDEFNENIKYFIFYQTLSFILHLPFPLQYLLKVEKNKKKKKNCDYLLMIIISGLCCHLCNTVILIFLKGLTPVPQ